MKSLKSSLSEEFITVANSLVGKICWGIASGANTGSVLDIAFGKKILRQHPVPNPALSEELRLYQGEISIFIECAWRLDATDRIICGWGEDFSEGGPLARGLHLILDQTVERVCIDQPSFDLVLDFSNALSLRVFCDQTEQADGNDNYIIFRPSHYYVISNKSCLIRKENSEPGDEVGD